MQSTFCFSLEICVEEEGLDLKQNRELYQFIISDYQKAATENSIGRGHENITEQSRGSQSYDGFHVSVIDASSKRLYKFTS